jgi:hypothetical protein
VSAIGDEAFFYCQTLSSITVDPVNNFYKTIDGSLYSEDGKTLIQYAIGRGDHLFTIPEGVQTIAKNAFYKADNLYLVKIPNGVKTIDDGAFSYCERLEGVIIPKTVTKIGNSVFTYSSAISLYYEGNSIEWGKIALGNDWTNSTQKDTILYYYKDSQPQFGGKYWRYQAGNPVRW